MSRAHHGSRTGTLGTVTLARRRVLTVAATVGVGASVAGVAGLSLAGEEEAQDDGQALVISLRDARKGTFDIFSGEQRLTFTDKKLAAQLLKTVRRG
ncbi:hypothetical protein AB0M20_22895 [Actinoplanes sp. NPDC051633]|uniref:hypothetical protein n=1 Tax=Actinoplanes sp. NPDC051633 TaxID=3155670 RepID=UPI003443017D